jgi:hypothetical protein
MAELRDLFKKRCFVRLDGEHHRGVPSRALPAQIALTSDVATTDWYPLSPQSHEQYHHGSALAARRIIFWPEAQFVEGYCGD